MRAYLKTFWDRQHVHPHGIVGHVVGERMVRQHAIETAWTLQLLDIKPRDHVLEIGFGAGKALAHAARKAIHGHAAGVDVSRTMLAHARRRNLGALRSGRMTLLQGNVDHLPFSSEQFDKVFTIHTYYFWTAPTAIAAQLLRILKPQGMFVATLATGIVMSNNEVDFQTFGSLQHDLEDRVIGAMQQLGYSDARLERGPNNRHYNNVALIGVK
jgi:ubiquinone/menaquinone biosynthesis C-methylase UbiE